MSARALTCARRPGSERDRAREEAKGSYTIANDSLATQRTIIDNEIERLRKEKEEVLKEDVEEEDIEEEECAKLARDREANVKLTVGQGREGYRSLR